MPIYEYRCLQCGEQTEFIQRVDAAPRRRCAKCSGRLEKLISRSSFQLKGGGWYAEGYSRGAGSSSKGKTDSKKSGGGASSDQSTRSESKKASPS